MTILPEHEAPQATGPGETDAVTIAFGDAQQRLYGLARVGLVPGTPPTASGMGVLFEGSELVEVAAQGGVDVAAQDWAAATAGGVRTEVLEPLARWRVAFEGAFDLELEALTEPVVVAHDDPVGRAGGMEGYDQLVRVRGTVTTAAGERRVDCLGQRGHSWGAPDWSKLRLTRSLSAWFDTESAVTVAAVRRSSDKHHADEAVQAWVVAEGVAAAVGEPLVSTTYDDAGRQRHAGLELWFDPPEDGRMHRAAGTVLCGTTLDLGRLRLDCAFFEWRMEGRSGIGRYDVLRREDAS